MANKKFSEDELSMIVKQYNDGMSLDDIASKQGVHPSTIRRYLKEGGVELGRMAHSTHLGKREKMELKRILSKFNGNNIDFIVSDIDKRFDISFRPDNEQDSDFEIVILKE